ncbi:high mobility group box domain-containing protein [Spinellus fusiger]|nr:high mobility group box domain-containing protein [Spinellus fusiger]
MNSTTSTTALPYSSAITQIATPSSPFSFQPMNRMQALPTRIPLNYTIPVNYENYSHNAHPINNTINKNSDPHLLQTIHHSTPLPSSPPAPFPHKLVRKYTETPERLKRPPNAYLLFNRYMRSRLLKVNQNLSVGEISKAVSTEWKILSDAEREPYTREATRLKQEHMDMYPNFVYTRRSKAELRKAGHLLLMTK